MLSRYTQTSRATTVETIPMRGRAVVGLHFGVKSGMETLGSLIWRNGILARPTGCLAR